ncbi:calcium/sodium antiporter [Lentisphaerota bacterium ZTH]|nr:calcium/sodium antiporter [Lentisphaerota bacterium]WET05123.1 calcium/sodium antiporter [Lentisphaerota bacterium ZTH]
MEISFATNILAVNVLLFIAGLALLIKGCDFFIDAAAQIAREFKIPEIVIGLTLVSIGTSLPEFATDVYASVKGQGDIVIGDLVGSNITNIALVLGIAVLLTGKMAIPRHLVKRDALFMLGSFFLFAGIAFICNGILPRWSGIILLFLMGGYLIYLFKNRDALAELEEGEEHEEPAFKTLNGAWLFLVIGLVMIFFGAKTMVDNVIYVADRLHLNKALISATVVAFGTSVPELAVTIGSVIKNKKAIALGNIIGSCIFNLVLIMGLCIVINPVPVAREILYVINPIMILCGVMLVTFMRTGWRLVRFEGIIFLLTYIGFIIYNAVKVG